MIAEKKMILWNTKYGKIQSSLKVIMKKRDISLFQLSRLTGVRYEVVKKYYDNSMIRFDAETMAKFCYVLDCAVSDLITYTSRE